MPTPEEVAEVNKQRRALICDDHRLFGEALATVLGSNGWATRVVTTPQHVIPALTREPAEVCVMDYRFPGAPDTIRACQEIAAKFPTTRLIMLTAGMPPDAVRAALSAGVVGFARKEQRVQAVLDAINRVAAGQAVIDLPLLRQTVRPGGAAAEYTGVLTARERETLERLVRGQGTRQIASEMYITYSTARTHVQNVLNKLGVHTRLEAAALAVRTGIVQVDGGSRWSA